MKGSWHRLPLPANFAGMTEPTPSEPPPEPAPLVDTTPASAERTGVTYAILFLVLGALIAYFIVHALRR